MSEGLVADPVRDRATVARPRLVDLLGAAPDARVGSVVAPAGSGKTVLLSEWTRDAPAAWLNVERRHDDAVVFARDLVMALASVHPSLDPSVDPSLAGFAAAGGSRLGDSFVDGLCAALESSPQRVLLVLDDLHHLRNSGIMEDLDRLIVRFPADATLLIGSRWDPPLRLGRLRVSDRLVEVRASDLAFHHGEGQELLDIVTGRAITSDQAAALVERTEGWAAGLHLAGLSMRRRDDVDAFIDGFTGDDRLVADYLTSEVLRTIDAPVRRFLLRTSVLEWLTPELCDAVTGGSDGGTMLRSLEDHGLLVPLGDLSPGRYRYHHLFADLLRYQLVAEGQSVELDIRRRAAQWLLAHGEVRAAVEQYLAVDDAERAFEVISTKGLEFFEWGESATLVKWLSRIQGRLDPVPAAVSINLLAAQIAAEDVDGARETHRRVASSPGLTTGERLAAQTLGAQLGMGGLPTSEVRRLTGEVQLLFDQVDRATVVDFLGGGGADSCETMSRYASANADFHDGDVEGCADQLELVLELPGTQYPIWRTMVLGTLALCQAWNGRLTEAQRNGNAAIETADAFGASEHVSAILARFALAVVHLERLEFADATRHLDAATLGTLRCRRPTYHHLLELLEMRRTASCDGVEAALARFRMDASAGALQPVVAAAQLQLHVQLLLRGDSIDEAAELLARSPLAVPASRIDTFLATGDTGAAHRVLKGWTPSSSDLRSSVEHRIRSSFVLQREGRSGAAGNQIAEAATMAETEGLLGPFVDSPLALSLLRTTAPARPLRHFRAVLGAKPDPDQRTAANGHLVEPLTVRELGVLSYLPSRLTNAEIAGALYISVNTLKTHLRSIYRKLAVDDRDAAVARSTSLGLL